MRRRRLVDLRPDHALDRYGDLCPGIAGDGYRPHLFRDDQFHDQPELDI